MSAEDLEITQYLKANLQRFQEEAIQTEYY